MFPGSFQAWARRLAEAIVAPLARHRVDPNVVTVTGFVFNVMTAGVLATGHLTLGGLLLLLSGGFDMLDGALARVSAQQSVFGAFLDSLLDRYSESVILLALIYVFTLRHNAGGVLLGYAVAVGSLMISYARARAEGLHLEGKIGIAPRPERVLILGLGLLFTNQTAIIALAILAVLTHFTAMQRLYYVWRQTSRPPSAASTGSDPTRPREQSVSGSRAVETTGVTQDTAP